MHGRERGKLLSHKRARNKVPMMLHLCRGAILQPRPCDESVSTLVQTRDPFWVQDRNESETVATNQLARPRARSNFCGHVWCRTAEE